jgi:hypothetical protein
MRVGVSDTKNVTTAAEIRRHRVILPVYIPRLTGYFKDSLTILGMCLESLRLTAGSKTSVTLIANQCADEALEVLTRHYMAGWIDQLVVNNENRGRIDAVVSAAKGAYEPILTLSDCDVLFRRGWLEAVESLLATFPECGMASVVPHPGAGWHHTSATVLGAFLARELSVAKVVSDEDIDRHAHSIGMPHWVKPEQRAAQLIVTRRGRTACVGCGHFLFTVRREAVRFIPDEPCNRPLGAGSDEIWYDRPPDLGGYWRLATPKAYAYHLGNVPEPWMDEALKEVRDAADTGVRPDTMPPAQLSLSSRLPWRVRRALVGGLRRLPLAAVRQNPRPHALVRAADAADS